ncbi:HNH endonuclease [Variovorax sp. WS11]|uniref:HNH endonuclease signature motif containing protein n=1 Tax=Variovorax sp. WS11 TaxID=1105204 RepID=UPI000D0DEC54|nr:HNH endonuclease signature motif containing protein [Variovorax sp. WS11]NDZ12055.1 HNH endonuclease [Variovorax sp. WS11]PSL83762.1 HNH endonuclease [Variovorax sp. WS11]
MKLTTLKPRLGSLSTNRVATLKSADPDSWRAGKTSTQRGYGYKWQQAREGWLKAHPLCVMCEELDDRVTVATVVDHIVPFRGDMTLFWDRNNWQSLCAHHHSAHKQRIEAAERNGQVN